MALAWSCVEKLNWERKWGVEGSGEKRRGNTEQHSELLRYLASGRLQSCFCMVLPMTASVKSAFSMLLAWSKVDAVK